MADTKVVGSDICKYPAQQQELEISLNSQPGCLKIVFFVLK